MLSCVDCLVLTLHCQVIDEMLKEICNALISADVNVSMVLKLRVSLKNAIKLDDLGQGINKRQYIRKVQIATMYGFLFFGHLLIT
jgi:signal recognition particle GTPase